MRCFAPFAVSSYSLQVQQQLQTADTDGVSAELQARSPHRAAHCLGG